MSVKRFHEHAVRTSNVCPPGVGHERLKREGSRLERLYRLAWQQLHQGPMYGMSTHRDLLAHLLNESRWNSLFAGMSAVSDRDRKVAATVIQWLGTNVGRAFVDEVLAQEVVEAAKERAARITEAARTEGLSTPRNRLAQATTRAAQLIDEATRRARAAAELWVRR